MGLEEEIQQSKFTSEYQKLVLNLVYTFNWLEKPVKAVLAKYKITVPQYNILRILRGSSPKPLSPQDIKKVMIHKKSDLTRMLDRMVSKKLINRQVCESNRRKMDITITEDGLKLLETLDPVVKEATEDRISKSISESEAAQANKLIDQLRG